MKKILNVGGNNKAIPLPPEYTEFDHILLDIDPRGAPDIVCDARKLATLAPAQFDAVYCSHNLEHYYRHDVPLVLSGFLHVLKEGGVAHIRVPDMHEVMKIALAQDMDIDDILYQSPAGPIMVLDVIYGHTEEIEQSGQDFYAHKTGFTQKSLSNALRKAGFSTIYTVQGNYEITALAFKGEPNETICKLFGIANNSRSTSKKHGGTDPNADSPQTEVNKSLAKVGNSGQSWTPEAQAVFDKRYQDWLAQRLFIDTDGRFIDSSLQEIGTPLPRFHLLIQVYSGGESLLADTLDSLGQQQINGWQLDIFTPLKQPDSLENINGIRWNTVTSDSEIKPLTDQLVAAENVEWIIELPVGARLDQLYLWRLAEHVSKHPGSTALFVDDDIVDPHGRRHTPRFKPGVNPAALQASDLAGPICVRRENWVATGGASLRPGSPWFAKLLKLAGTFGWNSIAHIPDVLISYPERFPTNHESCFIGLLEHFQEQKIRAEIIPVTGQSWQIRLPLESPPHITIAVLSCGQIDLLARCLESIIEKTSYPTFEILISLTDRENDPELETWLEKTRKSTAPKVRVIRTDCSGTHATRCNAAIHSAASDLVLLVREEAVIIQKSWLEELVRTCQPADIAACSPRLISPGTSLIQSAGEVIGLTGCIGSPYQDKVKLGAPSYLDILDVSRDVSVLPCACMLVKKESYSAVGGMNETEPGEHLADHELSLKLRAKQQRLIYQPLATIVYGGPVTLDIGTKQRAHKATQEATATLRFAQIATVDVFWNPNLSLIEKLPLPEIDYRAQWQYLPTASPRILACPLPNGQGIFRITSPLRALRKAGQAVECVWPQQGQHEPMVSEIMRLSPDTLIVQHYLSDSKLELLESLHTIPGRPFVVFAIDDFLTNMAASNPMRKHVPANSRARLRYALERCDRMVASTEFLAEAYRHFIPDIKIVPNRLEQEIWLPLQSRKRTGKKPRIGWAGGTTHHGDLALLKSVIEKTRHEADWIFFGMCTDEIRPLLSEYHALGDFAAYPARLAALNLDIAVAPLEQIPFNQGKSNLRLLEYGILGISVVCTNIDPYQGSPACCVANTTEAWVAALRERIHDADAREREGAAMQQWVQQNYLLERHLDDWLNAHLPE